MSSPPPSYLKVIEDHRSFEDVRLPDELARIRHLGASIKEVRHNPQVSKEAVDLVDFLWQVLAIDYNTDLVSDIESSRHAKYTQCALQLHYDSLDLESGEKYIEEHIVPSKLSIIDLNRYVYRPAAEVDILPEAIDRILRQYLKCTVSSGGSSSYRGCISSTLCEEGVEALIEKLCWDWSYFGARLRCSFDGADVNIRRMPLLHGIIETTRKYVPATHVWRRMMERRAKLMAEDEVEYQNSISPVAV